MERCKKCVMPVVKGHVELDGNGVCNVCNKHIQIKKIASNDDQPGGFEELKKKIEKEKGEAKGKYDCAVGMSGGKDSTMTLYIAKKELDLNPLAIFIDNGFSLDEMYHNIKSATDKLGVDLVIYKPQKFSEMFKYLLPTKKQIYYCRTCHALIDVYVRDIANRHGIKLLLGGYTKGQEYVKSEELNWIYNTSDRNVDEELSKSPELKGLLDILNNLALYLYENFEHMKQVNPFQYIKYEEREILEFLQKELDFRLPENSWPAYSTNCLFNFVSQHLAMENFGYSQHETELSTLVRRGELDRNRALEIIDTPILQKYIDAALEKLGLKYSDII